MNKVFPHIEALRALAALGVMLFHFISFSTLEQTYFSNEVQQVAAWGSKGVELFYILSGFVMFYSVKQQNYTYGDLKTYVIKRCVRILPMYWLVILCIVALAGCWSGPNPYHWSQVLENMTFTTGVFTNYSWINPVFQTLQLEMIFYFLLAVLAPLLLKNGVFKFGIYFVVLLGTQLLPKNDMFHFAPYFILGMLLLDVFQEHKNWIAWVVLLLIGTYIAVYYPLIDFITVCIASIFLLSKQPQGRILEQAGAFSYPLYLFHGFIGGTILFFLYRNAFFVQYPAVAVGIACTTSVFGAYLLNRFVDTRLQQWAKRKLLN